MDVSELDLSSNGSRVLIGTKVSDDAAGNEYAHLYMHLGTSPDSVDLTPGFSEGVIFAGMTSDGSKVLFTTRGETPARTRHRHRRRPLPGGGRRRAAISS